MTSPNSRALDAFLQQCQQRVNQSLQQQLAQQSPCARLSEAMTYATLGGGKRIRPVLAYAAVLAVGGELEAADSAACAVELIHNYSLVHDDLPAMDDDDLRRGKATVHKAFDEATAILVGDALQSLAFQMLSSSQNVGSPQNQLRMIALLSEAAGVLGMVAGQALDFEATGQDVGPLELEKMHNLKTGALIEASVLMGALSYTETDESQLAALSEYASGIGLAFQVQDDILDETGDTQTLGKPQGSDRLQNKPTYVTLLGLSAARDKASELATQAIRALDGFSAQADHLRGLASYIVNRVH